MSNAHSAPAGPPEEAGRDTGVWEFLEDDSIALGVDNVEDYLLRKARIEADVVLGRLRWRMFGVASAEPRRVGIVVVLLLWLDESVLTAIKNIVNLSFNSNSFVTSQELLRFIEMELWLSFYATSPSLFYSSNNNDEYPPAQTAMPQARYMAILNALSKTQHAGNTDGQRVAPLTFDRDLVHVEDLVRRLCAEMGFVESETIASLDDDMIRLRSKAVDDIGLAHVRNPKKGYGPVQHGIVSITTGLFIGGHVATRGESTVDIIKLLQRSLCGVSIESQIRLPGNLHCLDRGYQSEVVNEHIQSVGGKLVGTFKRTTKFPFTYGKTATPLQREVEEKGEKSAYWAALKRSGGKRTNSSAEQAYALGYRDGLGSVTLCFTTERGFGPGKWSFVCAKKNKSDDAPAETNFSAFENGVIILTKAQRTPDWFLLRKFRATGSVVSRIFNYIAKDAPDTANPRDPVTDPDVEAIIMLLSLRTNQRHVAPPADIITIDLESKSLEELKVLCRERSLPISGTKTVLKNRLRDIDTTINSTKSTSLLGEILSAWFMKPVTSSAMKMGTHNEPNIASHIKSFLQNSEFQVNETKSYGLLCLRDMPFAAFSPDDIALMTSTTRGHFFAVLEYKTRVTDETQRQEESLATSYGAFSSVQLVSSGYAYNFKEIIPDASHRSQILHNIVCGGVQDGFLVYGSTTRIIRVVHVFVGESVASTYRSALQVICDAYMKWVYNDTAMMPHIPLCELGLCIDLHTLVVESFKSVHRAKRASSPASETHHAIACFSVEQSQRRN